MGSVTLKLNRAKNRGVNDVLFFLSLCVIRYFSFVTVEGKKWNKRQFILLKKRDWHTRGMTNEEDDV